MYTKLTKITTVEGRECVSCIYHGTEMCRIHSGIANCSQCEVFAAILNQLYMFEEILCEANEEKQNKK